MEKPVLSRQPCEGLPNSKVCILSVLTCVIIGAIAVGVQEGINRKIRAELDQCAATRRSLSNGGMASASGTSAQRSPSYGPERAREVLEGLTDGDLALTPREKAFALGLRGNLLSRYSDLFRRLKLSPEQNSAFRALLLAEEVYKIAVAHDLAKGAFAGIDPRDGDALNLLLAAAASEADRQIRITIGWDAFVEYQNYTATLHQRAQLGDFSAELRRAGAPLRAGQLDRLAVVLSQVDPDPSSPLPAWFETRVAGILDPDQRPASTSLTAILQARRTLLSMNRAAAAAGQLRVRQPTGRALLDLVQ